MTAAKLLPMVQPSGAIDPVCGMTVDPATAKFKTDHDGKTYYFCCGGCLAKFQADPDRYVRGRGSLDPPHGTALSSGRGSPPPPHHAGGSKDPQPRTTRTDVEYTWLRVFRPSRVV